MSQRRFGSQQELMSLIVSVQKVDPLCGKSDGCEILFYFSLQDIGPHLVQRVPELIIDF
jgi:hypothetical protein